ncbi:PAS domain S-box-containing protein/diguanylate cyclase (GGDEF) domain-containing protein [Formivibrio citricus]|uniref:PAS domain S-box-containing protein/diguanylate cyclase (GGDEF) domain-containing protein n=1 Tax=Formivibrio citricus TaxID=83765 RepID=A0A1I5ADU6_9NEIS|nr:bifunctional diguanylate cyclase/phosphodiesterase [Formivibrio citricus]SFN60540.1 PAS domain S-box-containing protein/diguanylate cyclase (GGDEF) domain-containing protein [Formivibrio citricus]
MISNELQYGEQLLAEIGASIVTLDLQGYITGWNAGAEQLFGYSAPEALGRHILMLYADENEDDADLFNTVMRQGRGEMEVTRRKKNGEVFWASIYFALARDSEGRPSRMVGFLRDITDRMQAEEKARLYTRIFDSANDAIIVTDPENRIISANPAYCRITGFCNEEAVGQVPGFLCEEGPDPEQARQIVATLSATGHWEGELWSKRKDGEAFPAWGIISAVRNETGKVIHNFCVFSDLTERKNAEAQIHRLAYYDQLTSLPNRALLFSLLEQALAESRRHGKKGALLCFNVAGFKHINDSFGHRAADRLLIELAQRLRDVLREADVVARSSADEFFIGIFDIRHREDAAIVARRLLDALSRPFFIKKQEVLLSSHVGAAVFPGDGRDAETLINKSAVALYRARESGQDFLFYSAEMNRRSLARVMLDTELRYALERNEFLLHYQPQYHQQTGRIVGAEALVRWKHPRRGLVPPSEFIPFAEETGLILLIGEWIAQEVIRQVGEWNRQGLSLPRLSLNLSAKQFRPGLVERLQALCEQHGVRTEQLELEVTETLLMHGDAQTTDLIHALSEAGFALALDDFGSGYSNLAYLHRFPFDTLKIDRSFVSGLPGNNSNAALVRAILGIAESLGIEPIAEGVETAEEAHFLLQHGCPRYQGFLFSRPLPLDGFVSLLDAQP